MSKRIFPTASSKGTGELEISKNIHQHLFAKPHPVISVAGDCANLTAFQGLIRILIQ
jgi:hypothetical protein